MANGCGFWETHGGGCGAQAGVANGCGPGVVIPGSGFKPAGLPMPLLNGVNDAPAGLPANAGGGGVRFGFTTNFGVGKNGLGGAAGAGLGSRSCRNRSIAASCPGFGFTGAGVLNESQTTFPFWFAAALPFRWPLKERFEFCVATFASLRP